MLYKDKTVVLDTNVILSDNEIQILNKFGNSNIVIPFKVLEELDRLKTRFDQEGANARSFIRFLDNLRQRGNLQEGVSVSGYGGMLAVRKSIVSDECADNEIISVAVQEKENSKSVILVSNDINVRVKCSFYNIETEEYKTDQAVNHKSDLYTGQSCLHVTDDLIDKFYEKEDVYIDMDQYPGLLCNEFLALASVGDPQKRALARFTGYSYPIQKVESKFEEYGFRARNKEQIFALDLLLDPAISIVTLTGTAGTGKTLCALAAALSQLEIDGFQKAATADGGAVVTPTKRRRKSANANASSESTMTQSLKRYKRLVVSRPIKAMGEDIGYMPGNKLEKLTPWIQPITDNLEFLFNSPDVMNSYIESGIIEIEAPTYMRGRSIANSILIIDEAQNLSKHEIKTIITRVGHFSKIVLLGDIQQIDSKRMDELSNGLSYAIEKFKGYSLYGHVTLTKGERSELATLASEIL